jgi:predicted acetyltransferase
LDKKIIGLIRVIKRKILIGNKRIKCAFLTSVGIKQKYQKKGYGSILMKKSLKFLKKDYDAALLIARKKADYFYDKFGFKGNSEFSEMQIKFKKKSKKIKLHKSTINLHFKKAYKKIFDDSSGYIDRDHNDWNLIKLKIKINKLNSVIFSNNQKKFAGYIIFKKNTIYEYALEKKNVKLFCNIIENYFSGKLIIKNPKKIIIDELEKKYELNISKRYCAYGGHMIIFFKQKKLKSLKYNINFLDEF